MSSSTPPKTCPKCGQPIPSEAPQGLCPKCLLREASIPTEVTRGVAPKAELPNFEELKAAFPQLEILELIGQGGMGFVYKARQPKLDRFVALKILPQALASDPAFTERFTREGRVLAKLNHPNIVTIHDFGHVHDFFYLLMEFVNGVNLRQAMQAGRFTPAQALALVPEICEGLQYAHTQGILHRDIKPENILLDTNGRVKIADFGIAKLLGEAKPGRVLTGTEHAIGTPQYMAPEQIEHPAEVDHRADIYSLGVVLYELLTGELPLGKFPPPSEKTPLNPGVDAVVLRSLEKQREKRYQSAHDVKTGVEGLGNAERAWSDDEWVLSCLTCGDTGSLSKAGGIRIGAASVWKRTLIRCSKCNRIRWAAIIKGRDLPQLALENAFVRRLLWTVGIVLLALLGAFAVSVVVYLVVGQTASRKARPASPVRHTKTILLHNAINEAWGGARPFFPYANLTNRPPEPLVKDLRNFSIQTATTLLPQEKFRPSLGFADGRSVPAGVHEITRRQGGERFSTYIFRWLLPEGMNDEEILAAATQFKAWNGKSLTLTNGETAILFRTTDASGEEMRASLAYTIEPAEPSASVLASVRVTGTNVWLGYSPEKVSATLDVSVPPGHTLDCIGRTLNDSLDEQTMISDSRSPGYRNLSCEWSFPKTFTTEHCHEATRQLAGSTFMISPGTRVNVFSVTNAAGDVFRAYLKLVPPQ